ncbi:MAG: hypothetical protein AB2745_08540 [Candidatus Thiodiazotropha endolucinida]
MTDFTATQAGDAKDGGTYGNTSPGVEGTDYPDFTNGGDTLDDGGFALTNVSGILGDDTATPPLSVGGTVTLSGDLELRPGDEAVAFNDGTLEQGAHSISIEPNDNAATLISLAGSGTSYWNASGAIHHDGTRNSNGTCEGLVMPETFNPSYNFQVNWPGVKYYGFGNGTSTMGLFWNGWAGDSFVWNGGKYTDCGQLRPNLGPQGFQQQTTFSINAVAIGAWRGTFGASGSTDHPIRLQNLIASPTTMPEMTNCLFFNDDPADNYQLPIEWSGSGEIDVSGSVFLNFGVSCGYLDANLDNTWFVITTETADISIGIGRDATSTQSFNGVSITGNAPNAHLISINGSGSAVTYTINDLFVDGCGYTYPGDRGDMPLIYSQTVTLNNVLQVHSGGGINPSLGSDADININRGTFHLAVNILCGEGAGAGSNATMIRDVKNCIFSDPYGDAAFTDGGGNMTDQTAADVDYNAFIETEMRPNNIAHPTLGDDGYFDNDMAGHLSYGTNDMHVTDFQFTDSSRHGYVWANSLGYANSEQGLEDAVLAGFGVTITGADQTADTNATRANYRAYLEAGFTSANTSLQGAGEGGVDVGAFDISIPSVNKSVTESGSGAEATGLAVGVGATDAGSGTDSPPVSVLQQVVETAAAIDSIPGLSALITLVETGAGNETLSGGAAVAASDTGTGADSTSGSAEVSTSETGSGVDITSVLSQLLKLVSDSGTAIDIVSGVADLNVSDAASAADLTSIIATHLTTELGTGSDAVSVLTELLKLVSDSGTATDSVTGDAGISVSDSATSIDLATMIASQLVSEVGTGTDITSVLTELLKAVSDSGIGSDSASGAASVNTTDTASSNDTPSIIVGLSTADIGSGADITSVLSQLLKSVNDAGGGADSTTIGVNITAIDSGSATDLPTLQVLLNTNDIGSGLDIVAVLTQTLKSVADTATGAEGLSSTAVLGAIDSGSGTDALTLSVHLNVAESGSGDELISKLENLLKQVSDVGAGGESIGLNVNLSAQDSGLGADQTDHLAIVHALETAGATDVVVRYVAGSTVIASISFSLSTRNAGMALSTRNVDKTLN